MEVLNLVEKMTSSNRQNLEGFLSGVQPSRGGTGACSSGDLFLDFNSPKSPFLNF